MQETKFIQQNKEKWVEFEQLLSKNDKDPDKLSESFIQLTDDLSYARTFYKNRSVSVYLNNLAQKFFPNIYKNRKLSVKRFLKVFTDDVPTAAWHSRKQFLLSFLVFMFCMFIGIISSKEDPDFANQILGERYVEMTKANIESGDPMAVYKDQSQGDMFLYITTNNLRVSFLTFIAGILFAMGSLLFIVYNGIMVGAFQHFFFTYEDWVVKESVLTIWQHGTIEISCIIIAGAAGMSLGKGLLFPGSYTRLQAFRLSAFHSIILFIGIVPLIIVAAFIESYITRHTGVPDFLRITSIALSLLFVVFYFVWLPYAKYKNNNLKQYKPLRLLPNIKHNIENNTIKSSGEVFIDSFQFVKKSFAPVLRLVLTIALSFVSLAWFILPDSFYMLFANTDSTSYSAILKAFPLMKFIFMYDEFVFLLVFIVLSWFIINYYTGTKVHILLSNNKKHNLTSYILGGFNLLLLVLIINLIIYKQSLFLVMLILILLPFIQLTSFIIISEKRNIVSAIIRMLSLTSGHYGRVFSLYIVYFLLALGYFVVIFSPLMSLFSEFIIMNIDASLIITMKWVSSIVSFLLITGFAFSILMINTGMAVLYYSLVEISTADSLKKSISQLDFNKIE